MLKAVIFDFDGVIVESLDIKTSAFEKLFEAEGAGFSRRVKEYHLANSGVSRFDKFRYIYSDMLRKPLDDKTFNSLCEKFSQLVADEVARAQYVPGAHDFLKKYSPVYSLYICSATPLDELKEIVSRRKISPFFKEVYGAPMPKAEIVKDILKKGSFSAGEAVYIGDAMSDLAAARSNNVCFIGRNTLDKPGLFEGKGCAVVEDLTGLPELLKDIFG